jgi:hypothetical protein
MSEPPGIGEERLRACLQDQYDLIPVVLEFLPLGTQEILTIPDGWCEILDVHKPFFQRR